jgi:hypothetical protein
MQHASLPQHCCQLELQAGPACRPLSGRCINHALLTALFGSLSDPKQINTAQRSKLRTNQVQARLLAQPPNIAVSCVTALTQQLI